MRNIFEGLIPLGAEAGKEAAEQSIIVLDTNVLLDLYRYSRDTSNYFLKLLQDAKARLWLPHHVGWEFFRRRATVRSSLTEHHDARLAALSSLTRVIKETSGKKTHVGDDADEAEFLNEVKSYTAKLKKQRNQLTQWASSSRDDNILESLLDLFDDRTAQRPSTEWFAQREVEGKERFERLQPPGFEDRSKSSNQYGDYFIWRECIERAKASKSPLVFVTRDSKTDWWEKVGNTVVGPHTELLDEFWEETGQRLTLLNPTQLFDELLPDFAGKDIPKAVTQAREEIQVAQKSQNPAPAGGLSEFYASLIGNIPPTKLNLNYKPFVGDTWHENLQMPGPVVDWQRSYSAESLRKLRELILEAYVTRDPEAFKMHLLASTDWNSTEDPVEPDSDGDEADEENESS